jgi:glycosyltransferase involved in cell wall biosynthesis
MSENVRERPLVSVVVPTYNRADMLADALVSVYEQDYRPIELVLVDDGSEEDVEAVFLSWAGGKIAEAEFFVQYIRQENLGGNAARNNGIQNAKGEFIAFLDSDDLWHSEKISKQVALLQEASDVGAVYCGLQHVYLGSGIVVKPEARGYPSGSILDKMLVHDVTAPTSTYMVRKDVFGIVGAFDKQLQARQDWDMWIRIAARYHIGVVPEVLVDYREHDGVRTASNPEKEINAYRAILKKYKNLLASRPLHIRLAAKASYFRRMGRVHFHQGISVPKAFGYQLLSILYWPFAFDSYAALLGMLLPATLRQNIRRAWNRVFSATALGIRSH